MFERAPSRLYHAYKRYRRRVENATTYHLRRRSIPQYDIAATDVVFVVVDCLRNDHCSSRYRRDTTPFLNRLSGVRTTATAAAPWTFPSVSSILTGQYPHRHGAVYTEPLRNQQDGNPPRRIRDDVYTIPELLSAAGHHTYFSTAVVTAEFPIRGRFPTESLAPDATATTLVDDALSWWDAHDDAARFAYLHLGDLHEPLPRPASQPFGDVPDIEGLSRWRFTRSTEPRDQFETYRRERIRLYDTVLRTVDRALERLFAELERRGDREDTLVVVTGDHGEEFWERESLERDHFHDPRGVYGTGHGHALVPEVLEVPLWIPGVDLDPPGLVSTTDLVPTVLSHLGYPAEELARFDGVPLQEVGPDRTLFAEEIAYGYDQRAVIDRDYHLIHSPYENETVVLDRDSDAIVHDTALAESLIEEIPSRLAVGETLELDELARRRLTDLGYGE